MNSQLESNKYFRSENNKLTLKDYLILVVYLISNFVLVILFTNGELELTIRNLAIYIGVTIVVSILISRYIIKKMDCL